MVRLWEPPPFVWSHHGPVPVELREDLRDEDGTRLAGSADLYARVISIDSALPDLAMRVTLWHEWLHLWAHDTSFDNGKMEEQFVQSLASALVAMEDFYAGGGVAEHPEGVLPAEDGA